MVDKGGFAAKRGLKIELLQIKAGATLMKALLSGEIDSVAPATIDSAAPMSANGPFADVQLATQGADLDRYKSLVAGITDAAVVSNEFEAVMPANIKLLAKGSSAVSNFLRLCIATSSKVLSERRDDLAKFVAAEMDAYKFALANPAQTIKVSHEMTNAKPDDKRAEFITGEAIKNKQIDPTLSIPLDRLDWMQNLFLRPV